MKTARTLIWILLPGIILFNWTILYQLYFHESRDYIQLPINFPKESGNPYQFSEKRAWDLTKNKKKIRLTLDGNTEFNRKKFEILVYETRKMKYTFDSSLVLIIGFTNDMPYREFLKIVWLCKEEMLWIYVPVKKGFIITGSYPVEKKEPEKEIEFIYL